MEKETSDGLHTGTRLLIELGTSLQVEIAGVEARFKSILIGMDPHEYVIIKAPGVGCTSLIKEALLPGTRVTVRYIHDGTVFGFQSQLMDNLFTPVMMDNIFTPVKLLFIDYPETVENYNLRSLERMDCFLPVKIELEDKEKQGTILDITEKGCRCLFNVLNDEKMMSLQLHDHITLKCQFPGIEDEQLISGEVRNIHSDRHEMVFGIEFHEITPEIQKIIGSFVKRKKQ
ncbi:hypothetical protein ES705_32605 [subsurface metagenome]